MKKNLILLSAAAGVSAGLVYLLTRGGAASSRTQKKTENDIDETQRQTTSMAASGATSSHGNDNVVIDDLGTDQAEASHILQNIRDLGFDSSDEKLALALGRPTEEIEEWTAGSGVIDGDVIMKARALALNRGIDIE